MTPTTPRLASARHGALAGLALVLIGVALTHATTTAAAQASVADLVGTWEAKAPDGEVQMSPAAVDSMVKAAQRGEAYVRQPTENERVKKIRLRIGSDSVVSFVKVMANDSLRTPHTGHITGLVGDTLTVQEPRNRYGVIVTLSPGKEQLVMRARRNDVLTFQRVDAKP